MAKTVYKREIGLADSVPIKRSRKSNSIIKKKIKTMKAVQGLGHGNSRERWLGFCTLCFCFPTKMLHLNAPFFPLKSLKVIVIFLEFHSTKQGLPLVDSWSRALD